MQPRLNLPILDHLAAAQNILIAGAGGGFDVFAGLPIYFTLRDAGKNVYLANYSFTPLEMLNHFAELEVLIENRLVGTRGVVRRPLPYFPEGYLAHWFLETRGEDVTVWMFAKEGAAPLLEAYQMLVQRLGIDAIILIDGGVDSLMRGDEPHPGTIMEDSISLSAVERLADVPIKILAAIGFGTEVEEGLQHYHALENIAALAKLGAFYGTCSLTPQMPAYQAYEQAATFVFEQPHHSRSHISTRIIPAVRGEFGNHHMYPDDRQSRIPTLISPLMGMYWFFDAVTVSQQSHLTSAIQHTHTIREVFFIVTEIARRLKQRPSATLPY